MSDEVLLRIFMTDKSMKLLSSLYGTALGSDLKKICTNAIDELSELSLKSFKSKIPIDTAQLRGLGLDDGFLQRVRPGVSSYSSIEASIIIKEGLHYGRKKTPISSTKLADILNIGKSEKNGKTLLRTQNSASMDSFGSIGRRQPTAMWEQKAFNSLKPKVNSFLNSKSFLY